MPACLHFGVWCGAAPAARTSPQIVPAGQEPWEGDVCPHLRFPPAPRSKMGVEDHEYRNICFTHWTVEDEPYDIDEIAKKCKYIIIGREIGSESEKPHDQGYIEFASCKKWKTICKILPRASLFPRKGTALQASEYCKKDLKWEERGTMSQQGKRNDLADAMDLVRTQSVRAVRDELPGVFLRYQRSLMAAQQSFFEDRSADFREVKVYLYWGEPGTGKTRASGVGREDVFVLPPISASGAVWFDGYRGQTTLVIDEYVPDRLNREWLLRICDGHQLPLPVKGSMTYALWTTVIFTSNYGYAELFGGIPPMQRRMTEIRLFPEPQTTSEVDG